MALISAATYAGGKFGLSLSTEEMLPIIGPLWGALFGLAAEDFGKAAAKVNAGAAPAPAPPAA